MPPAAAITDLEQLKDRSPIPELLAWNPRAVEAARFDRDELSLVLRREFLRDACHLLKQDLGFGFLADVTAVDWYPSEPRFEVVYELLAIARKQRVRLKVRLAGNDAHLDSVVPVWPGADFFEREVYDLFGVRFAGHPNLARIMMPEDWEGHPLRKDYPVEGYR